jgi:hypothetical protein
VILPNSTIRRLQELGVSDSGLREIAAAPDPLNLDVLFVGYAPDKAIRLTAAGDVEVEEWPKRTKRHWWTRTS